MRTEPLSLPAALTGLLRVKDLAALDLTDSLGATQLGGKRTVARIFAEVVDVGSVVKELRAVLDECMSSQSEAYRAKHVVSVHQLAAVVGDGVVAFSHLELVLPDTRSFTSETEEDQRSCKWIARNTRLVAALLRLQTFKRLLTLLVSILKRDSRLMEVAESYGRLVSALSSLHDRNDVFSGRVDTLIADLALGGARYGPNPGALDITLADIATIDDISIPILSRDLANRHHYYEAGPGHTENLDAEPAPISYLHLYLHEIRDSESAPGMSNEPPAQPTAALPSCHVIFDQPQATKPVVLELFKRAIAVSRFADECHKQDVEGGGRTGMKGVKWKLVQLSPSRFKELYTDVYDELVRKNIADKKPDRQVPAALPVVDGFTPGRNEARLRLSGIPDARFLDLLSDVCWALGEQGESQ
ncbi:hypothetical protein B0T19DRAFT_420066 [Cercophora scortea]|uniref:GIT Spa2 homology (SHD) domain-containing protein n=1 Tax=Cercophora scortea TaxID=314031 RepID=A0AAE0IZY3_9PEZI|nr:hypothetical protein B0T19DRAFT_420066 [Cercophora scortea]